MISSNFLSVWSLFKKEVLRFLKVGIQTIIGPAVSSLLFLGVFSLALGRSVQNLNGISFANFIAPGLIMMTILQNSFANSASSIGQAKSQGNIVDILMAPLSNIDLTIGICRWIRSKRFNMWFSNNIWYYVVCFIKYITLLAVLYFMDLWVV